MMNLFAGLSSLVVVVVAKVACEAGDREHACQVGTPHDHRMLQKVSRSTVSLDVQHASQGSCTTLQQNHPFWTSTRCQDICGDANDCRAPQSRCAAMCSDTCPCGGSDPTPAPAPPTVCSGACETEFTNCYNRKSRQGNADAYTVCRSQLDAGQGPLGSACTPGCEDSDSMQALAGQVDQEGTDQEGTAGTLQTGSFTIQQAGVSRSVHVRVPQGDGPFPVLFVLHGNGGTGSAMLRQTFTRDEFKELKESHVFVGPDGDQTSWNILNEASKLDDVEFVGLIIDHLASKSNVNANHVQLYGNSNGAALVNRILIESTDTRIVRGVTSVSQLNQMQYHNGKFYIGGKDNSYTQVQPSLVRREILALQGAKDPIIPVCSCQTNKGFSMNSDADSIYAYAVAYGYTGAQVATSDHPTYSSWSYLGGAVSSYTVKDAGHSVIGRDAEVDNAVLNFLLRG